MSIKACGMLDALLYKETMNEKSLKEGKMKRSILFQILAFSLMFLTACGGGGDSAPSTGTVSVAVTDATTTVTPFMCHRTGCRPKVMGAVGSNFKQSDIQSSELVNGVIEELSLKTISTGHYHKCV
jgi:hypothetical protein